MKNAVNWVLDMSTGASSSGPSENSYEGEDAALSGGAKSQSCSGCSGKSVAGYLGGDNNGAALFANVTSNAAARTTIRIKYLNGNKDDRFAKVTVNDGQPQTVAFLQGADNSTPDSSTLHADLKSGKNTIKIEGSSGWAPDVDRLMVPVS
jgi:hypothetical protein